MTTLLLALLWQLSVSSPELQVIAEPFDVAAPSVVVAKWNSFEPLPQAQASGSPLLINDGIPTEPGRVDILQRRGRQWVWLSTWQYQEGMAIPSAGFDRGVLVRFRGSRHYFWSEVAGRSSEAVTVKPFKNVSVDGTAAGAATALYVASERSPRSLMGAGTFHFVPRENALACGLSANGSGCIEVAPSTTVVSLTMAPDDEARVLRVQPQPEDAFSVLAPGNVVLRPKHAEASIVRALPWVGIVLHGRSLSWSQVVIDRAGRDFAVERLGGSSLTPPPSFTAVESRPDRGLVIQPYVGAKKELLLDPDAELSVFPGDGGELSAAVPLVTVRPETDGRFRLPTLGSGSYRLRLFSSAASSTPVRVQATAGVPAEVEFPGGLRVTGHVIRAVGGSPVEPTIIEVSADTPVTGKVRPSGSDLLDRMRSASADDNGDFRIVLTLPGPYRIRLRWGASTAERHFDLESSDIDLGDIVLQRQATLHGQIAGCQSGEAIAFPVPDLSKAPAFDESRASIDADGRFFIDGLSPGLWSVLIRCQGASIITTPQVVTVPDHGDLVIHFTRTKL